MKNLIYILILLGLTNCMTVRQIENNCDKFLKVCVTETEKEIVYRDTTIYRNDTISIKLPNDTVTVTETVTIREDNLAYLPTIHKEFGLIGVDAGVYRSVMRVTAYFVDSTFLYPVKDTIYLEKVIREESITRTVPVKFVPGFYKFTFYLFLIGIVFVIGWLLFKKYNLWNILKNIRR